jgi:hypothetical protein
MGHGKKLGFAEGVNHLDLLKGSKKTIYSLQFWIVHGGSFQEDLKETQRFCILCWATSTRALKNIRIFHHFPFVATNMS